MKMNHTLVAALLVIALPGCGPKTAKKMMPEKNQVSQNNPDFSNLNIPLADDKDIVSQNTGDQEVDEFVEIAQDQTQEKSSDFAWVNDGANAATNSVYFEFDQYAVQSEQQAHINYNIEQTKKALAASAENNEKAIVVISGHACHSAGSRTYNLALSEKRAKAIADHFVAAGVEKDVIKVVGRGQEVPAVIDGKAVTGSREEQWPNRRVEFSIINS